MTCESVNSGLDPRVRRTRKLLADALRSLSQEKRFAEISVQDIAERATVNRATFYAHYTGKEDLAANAFKNDLHTAVLNRFPEKPALTFDNVVAMSVVIFEFLGCITTGCPRAAEELQDILGSTLQQMLYTSFEAWCSSSKHFKDFFPGSSKETVATVLSWGIYGGASHWVRSDRSVSAADMSREVVAILMPHPKA